jgi:hypothetical protein
MNYGEGDISLISFHSVSNGNMTFISSFYPYVLLKLNSLVTFSENEREKYLLCALLRKDSFKLDFQPIE